MASRLLEHPFGSLLLRLCLSLLSLCLLLSGSLPAGHAQVTTAITSDGTMGTSISQASNVYNINGGTTRGSNLFHSFGLFSVGTGDIASFNGSSGIVNILSRVTGGQQSLIDGTLRSTIAGANLFLLNPAGILFGPNASLDLSGSFHVSTADYVKFANGETFFVDPANPGTALSMDPPAAFGFFGPNPAAISIEGSTIQVPTGQTLSVVGGDITMRGSALTAPRGRINLASVASAGEVVLTPQSLEVSSFASLGAIEIAQGASLTASGAGGGRILVRGGQLVVDDSTIEASSFGAVNGRGIDIRVAGRLALLNGGNISTSADASGNAGGIVITAGDLELTNGGSITSSTLGDGNAGDLTVTATGTVTITGDFQTRLSTEVFAFSAGDAGDLRIVADAVLMSGGILSSETVLGFGNAGAINLDVGTLEVTGGALITSSTRGAGNGGSLVVNATESVLIADPLSALQSTASRTGNAGSISVVTPTLLLRDGSPSQPSISTITFSSGRSGDILVDVERLEIRDGGAITNEPLFTFGGAATGQAGIMTIRASDSILISDHSNNPLLHTGISSGTFGTSPGGLLSITTPTLTIDNGVIESDTFGSGPGGPIVVDVGRLTLTNGGQISSSAASSSTGDGGTVTVTANTVTIAGSGTGLFTNSDGGSGPGGNIHVVAGNITLNDGATISAKSTGAGNAGSIFIAASDAFVATNSSVTTRATQADGGNIEFQVGRLFQLTNSEITAQAAGNGGNITIDSHLVLVDPSFIIASAGLIGGNIIIVGDLVLISPDSVLDASGTQPGLISIQSPTTTLSGTLAPLPQDYLQAGALLAARCAARLSGKASSFVLAGRDGLPPAPGDVQPSPLVALSAERVHLAGDSLQVLRSWRPSEVSRVALHSGCAS